jgi:hypothetical protein
MISHVKNNINKYLESYFHIVSLSYPIDDYHNPRTHFALLYSTQDASLYIIKTDQKKSLSYTTSYLPRNIKDKYTLKALTSVFPDIKKNENAQEHFIKGSKYIDSLSSCLKNHGDNVHFIPFSLDTILVNNNAQGIEYNYGFNYYVDAQTTHAQHIGVYFPCIKITQGHTTGTALCQAGVYEIGYFYNKNEPHSCNIIHRNIKPAVDSSIKNISHTFDNMNDYTCTYNNHTVSQESLYEIINHFFSQENKNIKQSLSSIGSHIPLCCDSKKYLTKHMKHNHKSKPKHTHHTPIKKNIRTHNNDIHKQQKQNLQKDVEKYTSDDVLCTQEIHNIQDMIFHNKNQNIYQPCKITDQPERLLYGKVSSLYDKYMHKNIKLKLKDIHALKDVDHIVQYMSHTDSNIQISYKTYLLMKNMKNKLSAHIQKLKEEHDIKKLCKEKEQQHKKMSQKLKEIKKRDTKRLETLSLIKEEEKDKQAFHDQQKETDNTLEDIIRICSKPQYNINIDYIKEHATGINISLIREFITRVNNEMDTITHDYTSVKKYKYEIAKQLERLKKNLCNEYHKKLYCTFQRYKNQLIALNKRRYFSTLQTIKITGHQLSLLNDRIRDLNMDIKACNCIYEEQKKVGKNPDINDIFKNIIDEK